MPEQIPSVTKDEVPSAPPPGLRICCACPETKKLRDDCVVLNGDELCQEAIENHKKCLRSLGFKI